MDTISKDKLYYQTIQKWKEINLDLIDDLIEERRRYVLQLANFVSEKKKELLPYYDAKKYDQNKREIFDFIANKYVGRPERSKFDKEYEEYLRLIRDLRNELPSIHTQEQKADRFSIAKQDPWSIKPIKFLKIVVFKFSKLPFHFLNLFRKNKKPLQLWNHRIPLRKLYKKFFLTDAISYFVEIQPLLEKYFCVALEEIKNYEKFFEHGDSISQLDFEFIEKHFIKLKKELIASFNSRFDHQLVEFEEAFAKVGTIEKSIRFLRDSKLARDASRHKREWTEISQKWNNTIHALFEDWRSELELSALQAHIQDSSEQLFLQMDEWKNKLELEFLNEVQLYLSDIQKQFDSDSSDNAQLRKKIAQINYQVKKELNQRLLLKLQDALAKNTLLNQIDRFEFQIEDRIAQLENSYLVAPQNTFDQALSDNQLSTISNAELLRFELEPKMQQSVDRIKSEVFQKIGKLIYMIDDIDEIVTYMLSSMLEGLPEQKESDNAIKIIKDGFQRAINKVQESEKWLNDCVHKASYEIYLICKLLSEELQALKQNEKVAALKLRINKAKAINQSVEIWEKLKTYTIAFYYKVQSKFLLASQYIFKLKDDIKKRFFAASTQTEAAREVSDFLNETHSVMESLPVIYRKLYALEPLTESILFEGRKVEINKFEKAYTAWNDGKYASVLMIGEKGSGLTSLIRQAIKICKMNIVPTYHILYGNQIEAKNVHQMFSSLFSEQEFTNKEDIIRFLNEGKRRVIVMEKLHKLFLRVINGTQALYELLDIIIATRKNVFWVTSISIYSFEYLEKTIRLSGFFSYNIRLQDMSNDEMSNLIIKRNRISGFRIRFEESKKYIDRREYKKLDEEGQQLYLKDRFFRDLNAFARNNVSMALIFWLLSTKEVSEDTITIKSFKKPDLSFISSLAMERVFVLHALVIHEGLSSQQLAEVLSINIQKAHFLLIESLEDGLLRENDGLYTINPFVYRSIIQLLKSKNLINQ